MSTLNVYYDNERTQFLQSFDLEPILNFNNSNIMFEKYWKLDNSDKTMNENELLEYGEYLLKIVDDYKESVPQLNWLKLSFINKPYNFDVKIFGYYCMNKSYVDLLNYLSLWVEIININLPKYDNEFKDFKILVLDMVLELVTFTKNPVYFNEKTNHYLSKEQLDEVKSFGYFNLKFGEGGRYGIWVKDLNID
jgi:hypothetical protein